MQLDYAKQQLPRIDQHARNASQLCHSSGNVPHEVLDCVDALENETAQAAAMAADDRNPAGIAECVDQLEELGNRALEACNATTGIDEEVLRAVQTVHGAIADLRRNLH